MLLLSVYLLQGVMNVWEAFSVRVTNVMTIMKTTVRRCLASLIVMSGNWNSYWRNSFVILVTHDAFQWSPGGVFLSHWDVDVTREATRHTNTYFLCRSHKTQNVFITLPPHESNINPRCELWCQTDIRETWNSHRKLLTGKVKNVRNKWHKKRQKIEVWGEWFNLINRIIISVTFPSLSLSWQDYTAKVTGWFKISCMILLRRKPSWCFPIQMPLILSGGIRPNHFGSLQRNIMSGQLFTGGMGVRFPSRILLLLNVTSINPTGLGQNPKRIQLKLWRRFWITFKEMNGN